MGAGELGGRWTREGRLDAQTKAARECGSRDTESARKALREGWITKADITDEQEGVPDRIAYYLSRREGREARDRAAG